MLGPFRVAVGGKTPGYDASHKSQSRLALEPCFYHERSKEFYQEVLHSYNVGTILDSAPSAGTLPFLAALNRIPYFGVTLTEEHQTRLKERLCHMLLEEFMKENSPVYDAKFAAAISNAGAGAATGAAAGAAAGQNAGTAAGSAQQASGQQPAEQDDGLAEMEAGEC